MCTVLVIPAIPVTYLIFVFLAFMMPFFKVTDPNDPRFEPAKYQLIDSYGIHAQKHKYPRKKKQLLSIKKLFPEGTPIEDVDKEMVEKRQCKKYDNSNALKYEPYVNQPNSEKKKLISYICEYEWWGYFFYSLSELETPRLKIKVSLDEHSKVLGAGLR